MNRIAALFLLLGLVAGVCAREYRVDRTQDIVYKEIDGKKLRLNVFVPKGDGPFPAVLVVHGGAWRAGSRTQLTMYAKSLARRGYSCFAINYRLAPKHKSPAQIEDCRDAVRWIRRNAADYKVDPGRIGAIGLLCRWPPGFAACHYWPVERGRSEGRRHKNHRCSRGGHTNRFFGLTEKIPRCSPIG